MSEKSLEPTTAPDPGPATDRPQSRAWRAYRAPLVAVALVILLFLLWPVLMSSYWLTASTVTVVFAIVALSLGLLVGRVGMVSLSQIALMAIGSWIGLRLGYGTDLPFPVIVLLSGLGSALIGIVIGLPSLWLSGLALALLTLMGASAITLALTNINFPNGGDGILGYSQSGVGSPTIPRPDAATSDADYFRYVLVVAAIIFLVVWLLLRSRAGRGWAAIRQSPPAALAAGVNVTAYRLWAFLLASAIAGMSGALLAGTAGISIQQFPVQDSITLLAAVLMAGAFNMWGAVVAAVLLKFIGSAFNLWGFPPGLLLILFGIGVIQSLLQSPGGIVGQLAGNLTKLAEGRRSTHDRKTGADG